jgi:hypothetical protein
MWFRGMHYNYWGHEDGGEELRIEMNGGVLWGRPRPGNGCSAIDEWMDSKRLFWYRRYAGLSFRPLEKDFPLRNGMNLWAPNNMYKIVMKENPPHCVSNSRHFAHGRLIV